MQRLICTYKNWLRLKGQKVFKGILKSANQTKQKQKYLILFLEMTKE